MMMTIGHKYYLVLREEKIGYGYWVKRNKQENKKKNKEFGSIKIIGWLNSISSILTKKKKEEQLQK